MQKWIWWVVLVLVLVVAAFYWLGREAGEVRSMDLVERFDTAEKRSTMPLDQAFSVTEMTIGGETKQAIFAHPTSRITWKVTVPRDAWLRTSLGINPAVWSEELGDGVLFRIGVSDGRAYEELLSQHVDPRNNESDRRWIPVAVDLSAYAGMEVEIIFNTNTSLPGRGDDASFDHSYWGDPAIFSQ